MQVTDVKVQVIENRNPKERLLGFATVTLDRSFVVRDIKVIRGDQGLFIAMPSRKATDHCRDCGGKNPVVAKYCMDCGKRLPDQQPQGPGQRKKLYVDVAHPVNSKCRSMFHEAVLEEYERQRAQNSRKSDSRHFSDAGDGADAPEEDSYDDYEDEEDVEDDDASEDAFDDDDDDDDDTADEDAKRETPVADSKKEDDDFSTGIF